MRESDADGEIDQDPVGVAVFDPEQIGEPAVVDYEELQVVHWQRPLPQTIGQSGQCRRPPGDHQAEGRHADREPDERVRGVEASIAPRRTARHYVSASGRARWWRSTGPTPPQHGSQSAALRLGEAPGHEERADEHGDADEQAG